MAGDGTRFGGEQFKPFIDGTEKLFIEIAAESFDPLVAAGHQLAYHFIYRRDRELRFGVEARLESLCEGEEHRGEDQRACGDCHSWYCKYSSTRPRIHL